MAHKRTNTTSNSHVEQLAAALNDAEAVVKGFEFKDGKLGAYIIGRDEDGSAFFIDRAIIEKGKTKRDDVWGWVVGNEVKERPHQCNHR